MSDYARLRTFLEVSSASDYSRADEASTSWTGTPTQRVVDRKISVTTGGFTLALNEMLSALSFLQVTNLDASNYITIVFKTNAGSGTSYSMKLLAGETCVLRDLYVTAGHAADVTLTANTATCLCAVSYVGT